MLNNINSILSLSYKDKTNKYKNNDIIKPYLDKDNYYITFTEVNKVGINPTSVHETPNGIYCYNIKNAFKYFCNGNIKKPFVESLPYANYNKYFSIFKTKDNVKILNENATEEDFKRCYIILRNKYKNTSIYNNLTYDETLDILLTKARDSSYFGLIWTLTYLVLADEREKERLKEIREERKSLSNSITPNKWRTLFNKDLGYDGVSDPSLGVISKAEPCQAVFFTKDVIEVIGTYDNSFTSEYSKIHETQNILENQKIQDEHIYNHIVKNCIINSNDKSEIYKSILIECRANNVSFDNTEITNSIINNSDIIKSKITKSSCDNLPIIETSNFIACNINNSSNIETSRFKHCNLNNCNLVGYHNVIEYNTNLNNCNIKCTKLSINLNGNKYPIFKNCNFNGKDYRVLKYNDLNNISILFNTEVSLLDFVKKYKKSIQNEVYEFETDLDKNIFNFLKNNNFINIFY